MLRAWSRPCHFHRRVESLPQGKASYVPYEQMSTGGAPASPREELRWDRAGSVLALRKATVEADNPSLGEFREYRFARRLWLAELADLRRRVGQLSRSR